MKDRDDYFKAICKVSRTFGTALNRDEILNLIVQSAINTMKGKAACLWLIDEEKKEFIAVAEEGLSEKYFHAGPLHVEKVAAVLKKEGYLHAKDATTDPRLEQHEAKKAAGIASLLNVPVKVKGNFIGILTLYTSTPRDFSEMEIDFLTALAEQGGIAIEHARLIERIRGNTKLFLDLATNINSSLDIKTIFQILTNDIAKTLGVKAASILLMNEEKRTLERVASSGLSETYLKRGSLSVEKSIADTLEGRLVMIKNATTDERIQYKKEKEKEGILSILSVPINTKEKVIGVLRLYSKVEMDFTEDEIMLVNGLAHVGGRAIQNASMYLKLQEEMKDLQEDIWSHRSWF